TQSNPGFYLSYVPLAELKLNAGEFSEAIRFARQALTLNPTIIEARFILSRAYIGAKDFRAAAAGLDFLVKSIPSDPGLSRTLGLLRTGQGNLIDAEKQFESALRANPRQSESLSALANLYMQQRQPEKAIQRINQAILQLPQEAALYQVLAQTYDAQKN